METNNKTLNLYRRLKKWPMGRKFFSLGVCVRSPYFFSIRPEVISLSPGRMEARLSQSIFVQNHIGSIHALAMGNLAEFVAGVMMEASIPPHMRWIPRGLSMSYDKVAKGAVSAVAEVELPQTWQGRFDLDVSVVLRDKDGNQVVSATVPIYISEKSVKAA